MAQLGARLHGMQEVASSSLVGSTLKLAAQNVNAGFFITGI